MRHPLMTAARPAFRLRRAHGTASPPSHRPAFRSPPGVHARRGGR